MHISKIMNQGKILSQNEKFSQSVRSSKAQMDPLVLKEMNDFLQQCQKQPSVKKKVQDTLQTLQETLVDYRAQQGLQASLLAQKRLRDRRVQEEEAKEKSIQKMLEQTAVLDSPIRAANLQEVLRKQWCEYPDSYIIMSKLTPKQQYKLDSHIL